MIEEKNQFYNRISNFSASISEKKWRCSTEEATKHSLILPVISFLGYDIFDPDEVVPEVDCSIKQNGDKVDYVIMDDGHHRLLVECKHWNKNLDGYVSQLASYYAASEARIGILTNGIEYRLYADLDKNNLMDCEPFLVVNIEKLTDEAIEGLEMLRKTTFNIDDVIAYASVSSLGKRIRGCVRAELLNPSRELVIFFAKKSGLKIQTKQLDLVTAIVSDEIRSQCSNDDAVQRGLQSCDANEKALSIIRELSSNIIDNDRLSYSINSHYTSFNVDKTGLVMRFLWKQATGWCEIAVCNAEGGKTDYIRYELLSIDDISAHANDIRERISSLLTWTRYSGGK